MNQRLKTTLLVFLALTTVGTGILAWQQYRMLQSFRGDSSTSDDYATLRKKLADAEHRAHALQNELDALKAKHVADNAPPGDEPPPGANDAPRSRFRGRGGPDDFMALMNDPKVMQLMSSREKLMLDSTYAALFKSLTQGSAANLTPEQLDAFKNLLVEKQNTLRDVMMTARSQGVTDRSEVSQLVKDAQADLDAQIQSTLGADGYNQYQQYEKTLPQRTVVNQLTQSLSYTSSPLSDVQSQQLVQILADNSSSTNSSQRRFGGILGSGGGGATITDTAVTQAQSVLTAAQLQALTALQQQQKAQEELARSIRNTQLGLSPPSTSSTTPKALK